MSVSFEINATARTDGGKGASRRLRRTGLVPGIVYGGGEEPLAISAEHHVLAHDLQNEAFYSHILNLKLGGKTQQVILKDLQRHPAKPFLLHFDLLRVSAKEAIRVNVPLHFKGEEVAPGVKTGGGHLMTQMNEVEVSCLPADLPEFIEVDVSAMELGDHLHLSHLELPAGVEIPQLAQGEDHDLPVAAVQKLAGEKEADVDIVAEDDTDAATEEES